MGRRSRFIAHRRTYLKLFRREWEVGRTLNDPPDDYLLPWAQNKQRALEANREEISFTFKDRVFHRTAVHSTNPKPTNRVDRRHPVRGGKA
jgi:hypothetical protein